MLDERGAGLRAEPVDDVEHAGGTPASSASVAKKHAEAGVCSEGFTTEALPQNAEGNAFQASSGAAC